MKIAIYPYKSDSNQYIELIKKAIIKLDIDINSFDDVYKDSVLLNDTEIFIFNWYESLYINSFFRQTIRFIRRYFKLIVLKLKRKKIIWVLHNKIPHDSKFNLYSNLLMKFFSKQSYKIIIHSMESREYLKKFISDKLITEKVVYVPHPNYIGVYKDSDLVETNKHTLNLLFIGAIKPYKNIDILIKAFNDLNLPDMTLKLAGKVSSNEYKSYIEELISYNKNIIPEFRFIKDDEINDLIRKSNILVLPYDIKSSLNSGTIILAFSNKRTVLSPMIGTLKDFDNNKMFFSYDYDDEITHIEELKKVLLEVYNLHKINHNKVYEMGIDCYNMVKFNNSIDKVSESLRKILV